jgi:hypothetical protein
MSGIRVCPLCETQRYKSDGKIVIDQHELSEFRLCGYTLNQILDAIKFAKERGWK